MWLSKTYRRHILIACKQMDTRTRDKGRLPLFTTHPLCPVEAYQRLDTSNLLIESPWVNKTCLILTRWTFAHSNVTGWDASLCPHMRDKYLSTITWRHVTESTGLWRHLTETTGLTYLRARVTSMQARVTSMQVLTPLKRAYITSGRIACKQSGSREPYGKCR